MKMNLILHPGHGKCGSTSIQKFLYDNRATFEAKGCAVPDRFFYFRFEKNCDFSVAQPAVCYLSDIHKQGNYSLLNKRIERSIENAEKSDIHTFILSAENLANITTGPLHEIFSKYFDVKKVLYYIRRQDDFLLSAWQQWGHKSGRKFAEYCNHHLKSGHPVYTDNAKMLESHYGRDTLEVAPFSRKAFHNGDLISDFLVKTGLDAFNHPKSTASVENRSLNPLVCDYLAQFPEIYITAHDNHPKTNLEKYKSSEPWLFDPRKDYLDDTQRRSILDHFEADNRNLHSVYFPYFSYDLMFGVSANNQSVGQEQLPKLLEKHQLDFLEHWVETWLRSKNTRAFFISKARLIQTIKRHLSRSK